MLKFLEESESKMSHLALFHLLDTFKIKLATPAFSTRNYSRMGQRN